MFGRSKIRVLIQNRPGTFTQRGGDTVVIEHARDGLRARGVDVTVDVEAKEDPRNYDIVHLFNFVTAELTKALGQRAKQAGVPFVVTTLCEDVQNFHNQSPAVARQLFEYISRGYDAAWWEKARIDLNLVKKATPFDNAWLVDNAAALLVSGKREGQVIERLFGKSNKIRECLFGYDVGAAGDPQLFINQYGIKDFVLCVGRIESRKNQLMLLKALEHSELPVVLAGGGFTYQPDYFDAVKNFRRKGKTIIAQRLSPEMLASAYAAAKVHALPSWYELPGIVSLEAAYHRCNVVVTEYGTARDYLGDYAFYCDPSDERSIFNSITAAYNSPFNEILRENVMSTTWDKMADATLNTYGEILGLPKLDPKLIVKEVSLGSAPVPQQNSTPVIQNAAPPVYDWSPGVGEFQELLDKGEIAAREKDFAKAHEFLNKAAALNPASLRAMRAHGAVFLAESNVDQAQQYFSRAHAIDSRDPKTLSGLGMCLMMRKNPTEAQPFFVRALQADAKNIVALLQLVECSYAIGRFEELEQALVGYLKLEPNDLDIRFCLAGCLYKLGRNAEASVQNNMILEAKPDHRGASELREVLAPLAEEPQSMRIAELEELKRGKKYDEAKRVSESMIMDQTASTAERERAVLIRAEIAVLEGDLMRGEKAFDEVLKNNPRSARALCGKATLAAHSGDWKNARALFTQANQIEPNYDVAQAGLGVCSLAEQQTEQAWSHFSTALDRNPENARALLGVIEVGLALKKHAEIEARVKRYLEAHPVDLEFMYTLAACLYAQGRVDEAVVELNKIAIFNPAHARATELRAAIENQGVSAAR